MTKDMTSEFKRICEPKRLRDMYMVEVGHATILAFKELGYEPPRTIKRAIDVAWVNSDRDDWLYEYVDKVWRAVHES